MTSPQADPALILDRLRRWLLGIVWLGVLGTASELVFMGHTEETLQWTPLVMLGASVPLLVWHGLRPTRLSVHMFRGIMGLFLVSAAVGIGLHYRGNVEFELETHPTESGATLIEKTLTGATPVLAPGSMALIGLVGLAATARHPSAADSDSTKETHA